ncbi:hypothetical protein SAMN04487930_101202 [Cytophaga hutchinsonii ATCC 33406]|nr:hypothetical protein SAMN04487930_101202 [Cytophaga hutchinsonii ATCC 33406]
MKAKKSLLISTSFFNIWKTVIAYLFLIIFLDSTIPLSLYRLQK